MIMAIVPIEIIYKIQKYGSSSLSDSEKLFIVQVFRQAALNKRPEFIELKHRIQQAHLEYCLSMGQARKPKPRGK